jgi:hypothetical protein
VFGRLYYHLDPMYEVQRNNHYKKLFTPKRGEESNCIDFPILCDEHTFVQSLGCWARRPKTLAQCERTRPFGSVALNRVEHVDGR